MLSIFSGGLWSRRRVLCYLIAFRIFNALLIRTFFQPDEYFQSLEPAWATAFGLESGAWVTWEWKQRLRSSLHPVFFAGIYRLADLFAQILSLSSSSRSSVLVAAPKVVQAVFAAFTDYYTVQLARKAYHTPDAARGALFLTVFSPWQFFCSTRTLSNSIETTLTAAALYAWPFESAKLSQHTRHSQMCIAFALAALATILRPTNVLIWLVIALYTAGNTADFKAIETMKALLVETKAALISGLSVFVVSAISDRLFYADWTFPPLRFIYFNVYQSLAVFYGRNRPDYYLTEGLPLLLTTSLPFAAWGLYRSLTTRSQSATTATLRPLGLSVMVFVVVMSLIAHKEVRFIYPLLPALHVLASSPFAQFFNLVPSDAGKTNTDHNTNKGDVKTTSTTASRRTKKTILLAAFIVANVSLAGYITQIHQRGVIDVLGFLRSEYETRYQPHQVLHQQDQDRFNHQQDLNEEKGKNMTVHFLMPCHSTPWRSHLIHNGIDAKALTCEPPIDVPIAERATYLDEADVFYLDPEGWIRENFGDVEDLEAGGRIGWPEYMVFFAQLEETLEKAGLGGGEGRGRGRYEVVWRGFNTHWHDDWRRVGDVIVWKLR